MRSILGRRDGALPRYAVERGIVHETALVGAGDSLHAVAQSQLAENVIDMRFDGRLGHEELVCHFGV
jgi:hypothetical protein